jgi:NAD(P)-dependent dehydrogenase (short-subunit alcohol dehydrogenase family)
MSTTSQHQRRFEGKVALITGASRGIGEAAAHLFAREGASVVLAARHAESLTPVEQAIISAGGRALAIPTDVGDPGSVERLLQQTLDAYGRLDFAFNNAGGSGGRPAPLADMSVEEFDSVVQSNLRGTFLCMKYEIPALLPQGGVIVNMSSTAGLNGVRGIGAYVASKHGIIGLTKSAALDYAGQNLRINVVAPGPIVTERLANLPQQARDGIAAGVPLRRLGQPDDVAATVAWLCSDEASFITGAVISIDGGRMAGLA